MAEMEKGQEMSCRSNGTDKHELEDGEEEHQHLFESVTQVRQVDHVTHT